MGIATTLLHGAAALIAAGASLPAEERTDDGKAECVESASTSKDRDKAAAKCSKEPNTVEGLTVEGQKRGKTEGPIEPELVLDEEALKTYGANTVAELIVKLQPQLRSDKGRGDEPPVTLINGQRTAGPQDTRGLPMGAVLKAEILPEEAALAYGYRADQKVLNLILKKNFQAKTVTASARRPTDGGFATTEQQLGLFKIDNKARKTLNMRYSRGSPLYETERDIVRDPAGLPYDLTGNVVGFPSGAELDPALSALSGGPISTAAVPASAVVAKPGLVDFAAGAGQVANDDLTASRTFAQYPRTETLAIDTAYYRNFGYVTATISGGLDSSSRVSFQGLPTAIVTLPAGSPFSPFGKDVTLYRAFDVRNSMRQQTDTDKVEAGLVMLGMAAGWRWTFTGALDRTESDTRSGRGLDTTAFRDAVAARDPTVNPFGPMPSALLRYAPEDTANSVTTNAKGELTIAGKLAELPTGRLRATFKGALDTRRLSSESVRSGVRTQRDFVRDRATLYSSLDLPILNRDAKHLGFLGDASVNGNIQYERFSDVDAMMTIGVGASWTPVKGFTLSANYRREDGEPSPQQINSPIIQTLNVSMYDFATGQTVAVTQINGGNPNLRADNRRVSSLSVNYKPFQKVDLSLNASLTATRIADQIAPLPAISPELEAAFPERFVRDASGRLTTVDLRTTNFAHADQKSLRWGFNYSHRWGYPQPPEKGKPAPPPRTGPVKQGAFSISLTHTWKLEDEVVIREGMAPLNLLAGASLGRRGGTPRHEVTLQTNLFQNGVGFFTYSSWKSATHVDGGPRGDDLDFSDIPIVGVQAFADLSSQPKLIKQHPWLKGAWLNLAVDNAFNTKQRVRDALGRTPQAYQPDYMDPTGRAVRLVVRKQF